MKKLIILLFLLFYTFSSTASPVKINVEIINTNTNTITVGYLLIKETKIFLISPLQNLYFKIVTMWDVDHNNYGYVIIDDLKNTATLTFKNSIAYLYINTNTKYNTKYLELNIINP